MGEERRSIACVSGPVVGTATVPGSKSMTNRALALAALCDGTTLLENALFADDTARMMDCLTALGFALHADLARCTIAVEGRAGRIPVGNATLFVGNSGTTARFITPLVALGTGTFVIDGVARMRERPIGDLVDALQALDVPLSCPTGCPPLTVFASGLHGGACTIRSDSSSQFLSGLLMAAPCALGAPTRIEIVGPILSAPYLEMTLAMMADFGAEVDGGVAQRRFVIPANQRYRTPQRYPIEPDASAASYFFAAAAVTQGRVRIEGLGQRSLQGDTAFVDVLARMGCRVVRDASATEVHGPPQLAGVTVDMNAISDTVMTLAAIAPFAATPTVIENVGHIRHKETDRLTAVATELRRLGVSVDERPDGLTIYPAARLRPALIQTYDDHRMAMAFSVTGLRSPGIVIADPGCVSKTVPDFFDRLDTLVLGRSSPDAL